MIELFITKHPQASARGDQLGLEGVYTRPVLDDIPDARDGLTRKERVVQWVLGRAEGERKGRGVRAAMIYGRVLEHVDLSIEELMQILERLSNRRTPQLTRSQQSGDRRSR
jgi:hypothetical protein